MSEDLTPHIDHTTPGTSPFDRIRRVREDGNEYWSARELLLEFLEYTNWRNAEIAVERAKKACRNSGFDPDQHFDDVIKSSPMPNGGVREINDYHLSRFACSMVAQAGDPDKPMVAGAQAYFVIRSRRDEVREESLANISTEALLRLSEQTTAMIRIQLDQERRILDNQRAQQAMSRVQQVIQEEQLKLKSEVDQLEAKHEDTRKAVEELVDVRQKALEAQATLPLCPHPAEPKGTRAKINEIVRSFCIRKCVDPGEREKEFRSAYCRLYREFRDRYETDLAIRAKRRGGRTNGMDIAEELGVLDDLWALATELYGPQKDTGEVMPSA